MAIRNKRRGREGSSVNLDLSGVEVSRKAIPEGTYAVVVNKAELTKSREGNNMIKMEFEVTEGPHKGAKLFENCSLQPQALFKLKSVMLALGMNIPDGSFDLDTNDLVGLNCEVEVGHETYEGKKRARILEYINAEEANEDEEDSDDSEEEDDEDEVDLEEKLEEMSKDELKDLALELDIPKKKVLAAKKAKALIDLILDEADEEELMALLDGENDDEEDEDDEEETDYSEMSLSELKAECKDRGLKVKKGMSKEDLIEMLEEDDEE